MSRSHIPSFAVLFVLASAIVLPAADESRPAIRPTHNDESKVPSFTLPDVLATAGGTRVADAAGWREKRRAEILELFRTQVYGRSPGRPEGMTCEVTGTDPQALNGKATRREITVYFSADKAGPQMSILLYLPNDAKKPVPAFVGMNFQGNHAIHADPGITLSKRWMGERGRGIVDHRATDASRGGESSRWPVEKILARGYALATIYYGDLEADHRDGWKEGIRGHWLRQQGRSEFAADDWGAIGAWAWGLSRAMDYLETAGDIDAKHVAVIGHSRLGKTSLWSGAQDERFGIVISNNSGEGGAAITRRQYGETIGKINTAFPHWFCAGFKQYNDREDALPVDAHELLALAAPRAVYVASATEDQWADPRGEFLACKEADPVWRLFGLEGLGVAEMPAPDQPVGRAIGYHLRTGKHDVTDYDWDQYLAFADRHFGKSKP